MCVCVLDRQINLDLIIKDKNNNVEKSWEKFLMKRLNSGIRHLGQR